MPRDSQLSIRIRATSRLSALRVAKLKEPGLYKDGAGLRLEMTDKGVNRWALRLTVGWQGMAAWAREPLSGINLIANGVMLVMIGRATRSFVTA